MMWPFKKYTFEWQEHGGALAYVRSDGRVMAEIECLRSYWVRAGRDLRGFVTLIGAKDYAERNYGK